VFEQIDGLPLDLDDAHVRDTLVARDAGVRAAVELLKGRKPARDGKSGAGLTVMAPAWK
jgi:hypothetical protein